MHIPLSSPQLGASSPFYKSNRLATLAATFRSQTRVVLCLLLVWMLVCQTLVPTSWQAVGKSRLKSESETSSGNRETGKQLAHGAANSVLEANSPVDPTPDTLTDAVISRSHPNISGGRIEGSLRLLQGESFALGGSTQILGDVFIPGTSSIQLNGGAQHGGVVNDGGAVLPNSTLTLSGGIVLPGKIHIRADAPALPTDFPTSVPSATGTRTVSVNSQSDIALIGDWHTVRDLSVTKSGLTINVPPGNYGTFTVNGNSRLNFTAGSYNFANTFNLDGSASLQCTGVVTINVDQNLTINSGALVLGSYTAPGDVHLNVLGSALKVNGSSQVSGMVRAYNGTVTLNGTALVRGQVIANTFTLNGGKVIGAVWPAHSGAQMAIFGPRRFDRTTGQPNQYLEQFTLPPGVTSPFTLHIQNGEPTGSNRVSSATIKLNGTEILIQSDLNQNVANIDRVVTLNELNTLEVRLTSNPGSYLIINISGPMPVTDTTPPTLAVNYPNNNTTTSGAQIDFNGTASDTGTGATGVEHVYVNGLEATFNQATSTWTIANVPLELGPNPVLVRAIDGAGNETTTTVNITRAAPNHAPTVDAGSDQTFALPHVATLHGTASDDGLPAGSTLSLTWGVVSNPGPVTIANINSGDTTVSFSTPGTYVLRLTASDGELVSSDDITLTVEPANQPPTVNPGANQSIALPHTATLNGTATDDGLPTGSTLGVLWSQVSGPGTTTFEDAQLSETIASFSTAGTYVLRLTATDGALSASNEVTITVYPENQAPAVNAGTDQTISLPAAAQLNGSATDDGWPFGSTLSVAWTTVSGPGPVTFANANLSVTSASFSVPGTYVLRLTASDGELSTSKDLNVIVTPPNQAPSVSAGTALTITLPAAATLNGTVSDDGLPLGSSVSSSWSMVSGPGEVTFANPSQPSTTAQFSAAGEYLLRLSATDGALSNSADVAVTVIPENHAPTADAGADQTITLPNMADLNGSASDDGLPAGSTLTTTWSKVSGPGTVTFGNPNMTVTTAAFSAAGTYELRLTATDSELSSSNEVIVIVIPENHAPTVEAGANQMIVLPNVANLNGSVSDDGLPQGSSVSTVWSIVSGSGTVTFANPNVTVTSASFSSAGTYVLRLTANDSDLTVSDDLTVTVDPENQAPTVNAGADQTITLPGNASLNASVTDDGWPRGSSVSVSWSQVSGPGTATFTAPNATATEVAFSAPGSYVLRLTASDSELSGSDEVQVTVIPENHAPTANAGADQTITLPANANLNGTVSDDGLPSGSTLTSTWSKVSGPGAVTFGNANTTVTTAAFSEAGTYVLRLTASDSELSASDDIQIIVIPENHAPTANAGADQTITLPNTASLNGSVSDDGLPSGSTLTSTWSKVSGPGTVTFGNPNNPITTAAFSVDGTYVLRLTASDSELNASDDIQVIVIPENHAPTANAGADQTITLPANANLNGAVSDDGLPSGSTLTSTWSKVSGPGAVTFGNANTTVTTAAFSEAGTYVLRLTASDSDLSASDDIQIIVIPENHAPTANAGADQSITLPNTASLNGSVSDDGLPSGSTLTSTWSKVSGPGTVTFANPGMTVTSASFSQAGIYVLQLTANDSQLSSSDDVQITVIPENHAPTVDAGPDKDGSWPEGTNSKVFLMDLNGNITKRLTFSPSDDYNGNWSPQNNRILFSSNRDGNSEIYVMDADGKNQTRLTNSAAGEFGPYWSPDATKITFTSNEFGQNDIFVMNADGSNKIRLTTNTADDTSGFWRPKIINGQVTNGDEIVFATNRHGFREIYAMDTDGSNQRRLTNNAPPDDAPFWRPDGSALVFSSVRSGDADLNIYLMNPDGSNIRPILAIPGDDYVLDWSRDGSRITWVNYLGGNADLYTANADGSQITRLTSFSGEDAVSCFSPDGQQLVISSRRDGVYLAGSVADDGLPNGTLSVAWSKVSGPGNVTFDKPATAKTQANFSAPGTYVLRLTANDSALSASDDVTVIINQAPGVNAGADQTISGCTANLQGTATDDGFPAGSSITVSWSKVSGPGNVTFSNAASLNTSAAFSLAGNYVLRLTASDSQLTTTDDVAISVSPVTAQPAYQIDPGPTPYLSFQDSPFKNLSLSYFYLENFEDHLLNTPGVTANTGGVTSIAFGPGSHDSVDADDGLIDGHSASGDGYFSFNGNAGVKFTFNASVLGHLPTHVGAVWTDGAGTVSYEVFDRNGVSKGLRGPFNLPDGVFSDTTAEDRFVGAYDPDGISAIRVLNTSGGIEIDHLQYGFGNNANVAPVVNAGADRTLILPVTTANLTGTVTDDGLPGCATVTASWSQVSGPGTVSFANPNAVNTTATFTVVGSYVLRLTATDTLLSSSDDVTIVVANAQPPVANFVVPESTGTAGAFVVASSGFTGSAFSADKMLDDSNGTFWNVSGSINLFATIQFFDQQNVYIDRVRMQSNQGTITPTNVKDFDVRVSTTTTDEASFVTVLSATMLNNGQVQEFVFPGGPVRAKYMKLFVKNNYGTAGNTTLATFNPVAVGSVDSLLSLPGQSNVALSQSPALPLNGGSIYNASYPGGAATASNLIGYFGGGWQPNNTPGQFAIIRLAGGKSYTIAGVRLATWYDSGFGFATGVKDFEVWVSNTTPDDNSFTRVLTATAPFVPNTNEFLFPGGPVQARYVKYVPLTNGNNGTTINTQSFDVIAPGTARVVAVSQEAAQYPNSASAAFDGVINSNWIASGTVTNVWVKTALANDATKKIYGVRIHPMSDISFQQGPKDFDIRVSTTTTDDSAFTTVYSGTVSTANASQEFLFSNSVDARYVQFFWKNAYHSSVLGVRELEVLAAPERGSGIISFSSGAGNVGTLLDLDPTNQPWTTPNNQNTNISIKLVLPRAELTTINHIALRPAIAFNGNYNAPKDFQFQVSTTDSADASFTTAFAGTLVSSIQMQDFYFAPVQAKYVRLVLLKGPNDFGSYALHNFLIYSSTTIGTTTRFVDRSSDPDGQVVSWAWNFGDGTTSTLKDPAHTFAQPGDYTVSLTVTDNSGLTHTYSNLYHVVESITPDLTISPMIAHEGGESVRFMDVQKLLLMPTALRQYDFGDGSPLYTQYSNTSLYTYPDNGVFHVTLKVGDSLGINQTSTRDITVLNLPPSVDIDPGKTLVWGQPWTSVPRISDQGPVDRLTLQGQWVFGDGQTSQCVNCTNANATVTHAYAHPGTYQAVLTVTDKDGGAGSDSADFIINKRPTAIIFQNPPAQTNGQPLVIHAQLMDTFANQPLIGKPIQFKLNGATFNAVTGANGIAEVSVQLPAGTKIDIITGSFAEDEYYLSGGGVAVPPTAGFTPTASASHQGTNFWLMFPYAYFSGSLPIQTLYITSPVATTGTVTIPGSNFTQNFSVQANTVLTMQLPFTMVYENNTVTNKGVHVVSQLPVSVYGLDKLAFTSDAFLGLPVTALGMDYYILAYGNIAFAPSSELGVVATENNTVVTITPSVTSSGHPAGVPFNTTLNQGQTYLLQNLDPTPAGDLSGSRVTANKPIAVFAGHEAATIPAEPICCADHIVEQLPPTGAWGKRFATIPLATRTKGEFFRFIAAEDATSIYLDGNLTAVLNRGQWIERLIKNPAEIVATAPIMVVQYSTSINFDPPSTGKADPFTMVIPPYSQFLNHYTITTPATGFQLNYANVVAPTASLGSITLDGTPIPASSFAPIGVSGYSGTQVTLPIGAHNFDGPTSFGVFVYGYNQDEGYGYPGGMNMTPTVQSTNVAVTPETSSRSVQTQACVVATVTNQEQYPLGGRTVNFTVTGANPSSSSVTTDAAGQAQLCYIGVNVGSDLVTAAVGSVSGTASVQWQTNVPNLSPVVNAGADQTITMPAPVSLQGSATDDGLPVNTLNVSWSKVSGPGNVVFTNPSAAVTSATFNADGVYVLRLTASDTSLTTTDDAAITVNPIPTNQPPTANAGPDQSVAVKANLILNPGNEEPLVNGEIPGWTEEQGTTWTQGNSSIPNLPDAHRGQQFFYVGSDGAQYAELRQDVDVSAFDANIATGAQQFEFQTWVRSASEFPYPDTPQIIVEFRNATNSGVLATMTGGNGYAINNWYLTETVQAAPAGTRWIRVRLIATRTMSGLNDAYFDSVSLRAVGTAAVKLSGAVTDDGLPYGSSLSANWTKVSGPGTVTFANANSANSGASFITPGTYVLRLTSSDGQVSTSDDVTVNVYGQNLAPAVTAGTQQTITLPATATLNGTFTDDGLPHGSSVSTLWKKDQGPGTVTFSNPNGTSTTASFSTSGTYSLIFSADDSEYSAMTVFYVFVNPAPPPPNQPPTVNPGPNQTISLPTNTVTMNGVVTDDGLPAGSTLTISWTKVSGPGNVTFGSPNNAVTTAQFSAIGSYVLRLSASDGAYLVSHDVGVILNPQNFPPIVNAGADQTTVLSAGAQLNGSVSDDGLPAGSNLTTTWSKLSGPGTVTFMNPNVTVTGANFSATGTYVLRLTANDGALSTSDDITIVVNDDVPPPTVEITAPVAEATVTEPTIVTGSVSGGEWKLEYSLGNNDNPNNRVWTTFATGNGPTSGNLGTLDPTMMLNGLFDIRLTATDSYGQSTWTKVSVFVEGNLKVGNFTLSFTDLSIPVAGVPMEVTRTYDSRDKRVGDFGFGWTLGLHNIRVEKSGVIGLKWYETASQEVFPNYCLQPLGSNIVSVTFPGGKVFKFKASTTPQCQRFAPIVGGTVSFTPLPGTHGTLQVVGSAEFQIDGSVPGPVNLVGFGGGVDIFNSFVFKFTAEDGTSYIIDQRTGLQSLSDTSGNTLTIGAGGIVHSSGKSIVFNRDSAGRIASIVDPNGNSHIYQYDPNGDLISYTDAENQTSTYTYDTNHRLLTIKDPRGIQPLRNDYDADGRLISHTDAFGKIITYVHDLPGRTETITDRLGNPTVFEYDNRGNTLRKTDARGNVTSFSYDANGNVLSTTNALGRTTTYTYDAIDHRTSVTDPLGNVTEYTYNAMGKVLTTKDALDHVTTNTYDSAGKLLTTKDALNNTTTYTYSIFDGQQTSMTDALNNVTRYDHTGSLLTKLTDALGRQTIFTYDANGNRATDSVKRTNAQGQLETLTTTYEYDKLNRLTKTTFADGSFTRVEYNSLGDQSASVDQLGNRTEYTYDDMRRMIKTQFPDGATEETTYDAEGRKLTFKDRAAHVTTFTYNQLGELTKKTNPDGTFVTSDFDAIGRISSTTDARGNTTRFEYDPNCGCSGRRSKITDALDGITTFTYDDFGNQLTMTDARGHTTSYEYDLAGRRTRVVYHDGTSDVSAFDAVGRVISRTDQAGKITQFEFDALGRLLKVTDALSQNTTYAYDELGNQISQTDTNNHTTRFEYDKLGRRTKRILPTGLSESMSYDVHGNLASRTDFNGKTTTYAYDLLNRQIQKTPDASLGQSSVNFTYTLSGRRAQMTDATGVTTYTYDGRDHLISKQTPQGSLTYTYDASGNVATVRSSNTNGVSVNYGYDELDRLKTVTDNRLSAGANVTTYNYDQVGSLTRTVAANQVTTNYTYNSLNRLTNVGIGNLTTTLAGYNYTLNPTGNRSTVTELNGRTVTYTYDDLYRLTGETISNDPVANNGSVTYTYDAVGNRLSRNSTLAAIPSLTSSYDANDRLTSDGYDLNGNTISANGVTYNFDFENRLTEANSGNVRYIYDGDGHRVARTVGGITTRYLVDTNSQTGFSQVADEIVNGTVMRTYTYGTSLISQNQIIAGNWQVSYYGVDGQGAVRLLTDQSGSVTDTYSYDAFGNLLSHIGSTPNERLYASEQYDPNLGFYYLRARYMNPASGRFMSMDTFAGNTSDPQSLHKYLYANNNPANRVDPSGMSSFMDMNVAMAIAGTLLALSFVGFLAFTYKAIHGLPNDAFEKSPTAAMVGASATWSPSKTLAKRGGGSLLSNALAAGLALTQGLGGVDFIKPFSSSRLWLYGYLGISFGVDTAEWEDLDEVSLGMYGGLYWNVFDQTSYRGPFFCTSMGTSSVPFAKFGFPPPIAGQLCSSTQDDGSPGAYGFSMALWGRSNSARVASSGSFYWDMPGVSEVDLSGVSASYSGVVNAARRLAQH